MRAGTEATNGDERRDGRGRGRRRAWPDWPPPPTWRVEAARVVLLEKAAERRRPRANAIRRRVRSSTSARTRSTATGAGAAVLRELGVTVAGGRPTGEGGYAVRGGAMHTLPAGLVSLLTTGLLRPREKMEAARLFAGLRHVDADRLQDVPLASWLARIHQPTVRQLLEATARVATYTNDPERMSAGAALAQMRRALGERRPVPSRRLADAGGRSEEGGGGGGRADPRTASGDRDRTGHRGARRAPGRRRDPARGRRARRGQSRHRGHARRGRRPDRRLAVGGAGASRARRVPGRRAAQPSPARMRPSPSGSTSPSTYRCIRRWRASRPRAAPSCTSCGTAGSAGDASEAVEEQLGGLLDRAPARLARRTWSGSGSCRSWSSSHALPEAAARRHTPDARARAFPTCPGCTWPVTGSDRKDCSPTRASPARARPPLAILGRRGPRDVRGVSP